MNRWYFFVLLIIGLPFVSCSKSSASGSTESDVKVAAVTNLTASTTSNDSVVLLNWTNPVKSNLSGVEISFSPQNTYSAANPQTITAESGAKAQFSLKVGTPGIYTISLTAIDKNNNRSDATSVTINTIAVPEFLKRANTFMNSLVYNYLEGMSYDVWTSQYPVNTNALWSGAAVVWAQGAIFSGYVALKKAASSYSDYKKNIETEYDDRYYKIMEKFVTTQGQKATNTLSAYAVYPENGNERYYDDNLWIGIDMAELYALTGKQKYLDRAKMVWNFVKSGTDDIMGGGIYWVENGTSKNTCSNAPAVVLSAKLYQITKDTVYLNYAKNIYSWMKANLQDPDDYLYWDNISLKDGVKNIEKNKYTYNSGESIEAAVLLYDITGDQSYLKDGQDIAGSIYKQWGVDFTSSATGQTFKAIDPAGHVWFRAVMLRGLIELYKADKNRSYVDSYQQLLEHAWNSDCRNKSTGLLNYDFRGGTTQTSWELIHEGAALEMYARIAQLQASGL